MKKMIVLFLCIFICIVVAMFFLLRTKNIPEQVNFEQNNNFFPYSGTATVNTVTPVEEGEIVTTVGFENVLQIKKISDIERKRIIEAGMYVGDESYYTLFEDGRIRVSYSGINDTFYIDLHAFDPVIADRLYAEKILAEKTGFSYQDVCGLEIYISIPNYPFLVDEALVRACFEMI